MIEVSDEEITEFENQCAPGIIPLYQAFEKDERRGKDKYLVWAMGIKSEAAKRINAPSFEGVSNVPYKETLRQALIKLKKQSTETLNNNVDEISK